MCRQTKSRCLKITEKVSLNIASEASYVYILFGQKMVENAKVKKFKCDILGDFQTLWKWGFWKNMIWDKRRTHILYEKILWHTWNWLVSEVKFSSLNVHLFGRQPSTGWFCCWFQFQAWDNRHLMATFLLGCLLSPDCQGQHINWPPHVSKITLETTTRGEVWSRELQSYD